jgi:hypothetical protein
MALSNLLNRPCTITRRSTSSSVDEYGNPIDSVSNVETVCEIQQRSRDEQDDQAETSDTLWLLVLPPGTVIDTSDKVHVPGLGDFEMVGAPWPARNPRTQQESHVEATLRRTAGPETGS